MARRQVFVDEFYFKSPAERKEILGRLAQPCARGHSRQDAYLYRQKKNDRVVVICRLCRQGMLNNSFDNLYPPDLRRRQFGRLRVIRRALGSMARNAAGDVMWKCRCQCGNTHFASTHNLLRGRVLSCGCLRSETSQINIAKSPWNKKGVPHNERA